MKPTREKIFQVLVRMEQAGHLDIDGPTSIFVRSTGALGSHYVQYVVRVDGDAVFVRTSRLPFVKPMSFSRQTLRIAEID
ncbi:MAG: hypothetical protein IKB82_01875 [Clostridia bacterium]|nr:hypothetical protein [Clostridia bacterium]